MNYVATPEEVEDLYEIIIKVELDGIGCRLQRYPVKRTQQNFLPLRLTTEQEAAGYSHRMGGRVPIDDLLKVQRLSFGEGVDHVWRHIYCLVDQRETALGLIRADIDGTLMRMHSNVTKMHTTWFNQPLVLEEKKKTDGRAS